MRGGDRWKGDMKNGVKKKAKVCNASNLGTWGAQQILTFIIILLSVFTDQFQGKGIWFC